jgi:hypothetical protein
MRPEIRPQIEIEPEIAVRRPPRAYLEMLDQPEPEFRRVIKHMERTPLFRRLVEAGVVRPARARGRIPWAKYEAYLERQATAILDRYRIRQRRSWQDDFFAPDAESRIGELAARYGPTEREVELVVRYLQRLVTASDEEAAAPTTAAEPAAKSPPITADSVADIASIQRFVDRHHLNRAAFERDFLAGDLEAGDLARRYQIDEPEVAQTMATLERLFIADAGHRAPPARPAVPPTRPREATAPVARVAVDGRDHLPRLRYADDAGYDARYRLDMGRLEALPRGERSRARSLAQQLALVNQRRSLVCRIVRFVCDRQRRYLLTGEEADLLPLTQADIARGLGEAESTISRALRRKTIETPHGRRELAFFCRRKAEIVAHLHAAHPEWTDARMAEEMAARYECRLSRRTVAYHRAKVRGSSKRAR